jgi:hypothetical protein
LRKQSLTALYDALNSQFFDGRLPRYRVRRRTPRWYGELGECDDGSRTIFVAPNLNAEEERRVLLHEMCHIETPGHGARFRTKLKRLARMGEKWAESERLQYEEACRVALPLTAEIKHIIEDIAVEHPHLPWPRVLQMISNEVCRAPQEVLRVAPWVPQVWERTRANWRRPQHRFASDRTSSFAGKKLGRSIRRRTPGRR